MSEGPVQYTTKCPAPLIADNSLNKQKRKNDANHAPFSFLILNQLVSYIGQQCYFPRALDSPCQVTLMLCAYAAHTTGHNLAALCRVLPEPCNILILDMLDLINAEAANLAPGSTLTGLHFTIIHYGSPFVLLVDFVRRVDLRLKVR